jgi:hypothetical protein
LLEAVSAGTHELATVDEKVGAEGTLEVTAPQEAAATSARTDREAEGWMVAGVGREVVTEEAAEAVSSTSETVATIVAPPGDSIGAPPDETHVEPARETRDVDARVARNEAMEEELQPPIIPPAEAVEKPDIAEPAAALVAETMNGRRIGLETVPEGALETVAPREMPDWVRGRIEGRPDAGEPGANDASGAGDEGRAEAHARHHHHHHHHHHRPRWSWPSLGIMERIKGRFAKREESGALAGPAPGAAGHAAAGANELPPVSFPSTYYEAQPRPGGGEGERTDGGVIPTSGSRPVDVKRTGFLPRIWGRISNR